MKITVFTPTYNRAYIIEALYHSLQMQSFRDFEWLVVDDGSTDGTEKLFQKWQKEETGFPIRYYKKENGGKCRAINYGIQFAEGLLFYNVDSDDTLTSDALEKIACWEASLPKDQKFCGVAGNLGTSLTETPNTPLPDPYFDSTLLSRYADYSTPTVDGERAIVFYTDIQKRYPYPEFPGENFITEATSWNRMAGDGYLMRFFNDIICIYEYKADGLTLSGSKLFINNPQGHGLWLREKIAFTGPSFRSKLRTYYTFYCDHFHHLSCKKIAQYIGAPLPFIWLSKCVHGISKLLKRRKP